MNDRTSRDRPKPPQRVGPYRIEEWLGRGGMGEVYQAYDERLGRRVAVKQILPEAAGSPKAWERLRREARTVASLNHPSIVQIYDIIEETVGDWIVMEIVEGPTLHRVIREGRLDLGQALQLAREIAEGLAEAHGKGIVHRDLKTENVMITEAGHAKILDFGLAKRMVWDDELDQTLSRKGAILGTGRAMSPEQAMGEEVDYRSDLFSLGSLLFELFVGTSPFRGSSFIYTLAQVCTYDPPSAGEINPEIPDELSILIDTLLQKNPSRRPQSSADVVATLTSLVGSTVFEAGGPSLFDSVDLTPLRRTSALTAGEPSRSSRPGRERAARLSRAPGSRATTTAGIFIKTLLALQLFDRPELEKLCGKSRAFEILLGQERLGRELLARFESLEIRKGEDLLFLFERPIDAVLFAHGYLDALAELAESYGVPATARAGIHLGEVFLRRSTPAEVTLGANPIEVEGVTNQVTRHVLSLARAREVLLTEGAYELAWRAIEGDKTLGRELRWTPYGFYSFDRIEETVRIFEVGRVGTRSLGPPAATATARPVAEPEEARAKVVRRRRMGFVALLLLAVLVAGWSYFRGRPQPLLTPAVAVLGFEELSGERQFGWLTIFLEQMLQDQLMSGAEVRVVAAQDVVRSRRELAAREGEALAEESFEHFRRSLGIDSVLFGTYLVLRDAAGELQLRLMVTLQRDGAVEIHLTPRTESLARLPELTDRVGAELRQKLRVRPVTGPEQKRIRASLDTSFEALQAYCEGVWSLRGHDPGKARRRLEQALEVDATFALAHAALAETLLVLGEDGDAGESLEWAYALGKELPRDVYLRLEARRSQAVGDWTKAIANYQTLVSFLPQNVNDGLRLVEAQLEARQIAEAGATVEWLLSWEGVVGDDPRIELAAAAVAAASFDPEGRLAAARRAVAKAERQGAVALWARSRRVEGLALAELGHPTQARDALAAARDAFDRTGERLALAQVLLDLGRLAPRDGAAEALFAEARTLYRELGHQRGSWTTEQLRAAPDR